jgi:NAD(P)-dependent dehydrogenase (short-subunit alcohol dehydrogenase family)
MGQQLDPQYHHSRTQTHGTGGHADSVSVVVITGSTRGIGRGLAEAFAARGHQVVISGRDSAEVTAVAGAIASAIGKVADVSDPADVQALWDFAIDRHGTVDIWINNAGFAITHKHTRDLSLVEMRAMTDANLFGGIHGTQVALKGMTAQGHGWIWTMLGGGSDGRQRDRMGGYGMTKLALKYYTDAITREIKGGPVKIGSIKPGILVSDGFLREARQLDPAEWPKLRNQLNMLADRVDAVAPWIAERILESGEHGRSIGWLTGGKIMGRLLGAKLLGRKRDIVPQDIGIS